MPFVKGKSGNPKGKPKGATSKPRLSDYLSEKQVTELVNKATEMASHGDPVMLKFILEQHFGKAIQPHEGDLGGGTIVVKYDDAFTPSKTKEDSE